MPLEYIRSITVTTDDVDAFHEALLRKPEMEPMPDELGNMQAPFRIESGEKANEWVVRYVNGIPAALFTATLAEVADIRAEWEAEQAELERMRQREQEIRTTIRNGIGTVDAHLAALADGATNAEVISATQFTLQAVKYLAMLTLQELDS